MTRDEFIQRLSAHLNPDCHCAMCDGIRSKIALDLSGVQFNEEYALFLQLGVPKGHIDK